MVVSYECWIVGFRLHLLSAIYQYTDHKYPIKYGIKIEVCQWIFTRSGAILSGRNPNIELDLVARRRLRSD